MHMANAKGCYLPLTTGNKTEIAFGYCTINGDTVGGYNPIGDLYKHQVYEMANYINKEFGSKIPQEIIDKPPSAELAPGQTDEESLMPYIYLDAIAESYIEDRISTYDEFVKWLKRQQIEPDISEDQYQKMLRRIDMMEFKRKQAAPIIKVSRQAFGTGRRMPIVNKRNFLAVSDDK
jgi:NAD+ synthase (glutamine-hydrolysing)